MLMYFIITALEGSDIMPDACSCEFIPSIRNDNNNNPSICRISEPPPPGYKCYCYIAFIGTCNGEARKCKSIGEKGCHGCKEEECCLNNCSPYPK